MNRLHWKTFRTDTNGFSTVFDVLLFLAMVSICGIILLPTITGNTQIRSVIESKNQKESSDMISTLLNSRANEFGYFAGGDQVDAIAGSVNRSPVYIEGKKRILGKEIRHKTLADIASDAAASQWIIYYGGNKTQLNILMSNYTGMLNAEMKAHLDEHIDEKYGYNFTVVWRPVLNAPFGSDLSIGDPVPENAYVESAFITMPYHINFTRERAGEIIDTAFNDSFGNITTAFDKIKINETDRVVIEKMIAQGIFDSINSTIEDAVSEMVDDKVGPILDEAQDNIIVQIGNFLPGNEEDNKFIALFNKSMLSSLDRPVIKETLSETLKSYLQEMAKQKTHELTKDEINALVVDLMDMYIDRAMTKEEVKDRILIEVFSRISISRADVTLSIWEKRG